MRNLEISTESCYRLKKGRKNVYMRLARIKMDGGDILTFAQHRALAANLHLRSSRPLVNDRIAVLVPHYLLLIAHGSSPSTRGTP